jgi:hypothetical protein
LAALIKIGACGVCGTDQHILKGHWPKPLPWPFTLGHELAGVIVEIGADLKTDHMGKPIGVGSKLMLPPLMPCGFCDWWRIPSSRTSADRSPQRYLGFDKPPTVGQLGNMSSIRGLPGTRSTSCRTTGCCSAAVRPLTSCIRVNRAIKAGGFS